MTNQTAAIGRIVHFRVPPTKVVNSASIVPAMITQAFPGSAYVNLIVFRPFAEPYHEGSVILDESDDPMPRTFFWPPRV